VVDGVSLEGSQLESGKAAESRFIMKKTFNSDVWGSVETRKTPVLLKHGRITLAQARAMAALTEYDTEGDVVAGVPVGPWGDVLESSDVKNVNSLQDFIACNEISSDFTPVRVSGETVIYDPFE